jgi:uncharacterized phage infection (PIP) family protein YhgE
LKVGKFLSLDELRRKNNELELIKEKHRMEIRKLGDEYEEKLIDLGRNEENQPKNGFNDDNKDLAKAIVEQVEVNKGLRDTIEKLLHSKANSNLEEKECELIRANGVIEGLSEKLTKYEKKLKETRVYYKLFKHSMNIQCKYCNKFYSSTNFVSHSQS